MYRVKKLSRFGNKIGKYKNVKCQYNGAIYDSGFESKVAQKIELMQKAGEIISWERQVRISLDVNGYHICNYYIDFVVVNKDGVVEYIEAKGFKTDVWKLKWKLFEALYADKPNVKLTVITHKNFNL